MIYIIDDDKSVRRSFELLLSSANYDYISFEAAEDFLNDFEPDINDFLILDIQLPKMSGCDLLKALEAKNIFVTVLIVTAFDEPFMRECAKDYGVSAYLRKPIDGRALIDLIRYKVQ
jgi:FixJ family two-component response regulator